MCRFFQLAVDQRDGEADRTHRQGEGDDRRRQNGSLPGEHESYAEPVVEWLPNPSIAAEQNQQEVARDHRRYDQRCMDDGFQCHFAAEFASRQQPSEQHGRNGGDQRNPEGDLQGQPDRAPFIWIQIKHG